MKITKTELFLRLAKPNEQGISRWVNVNEFVGEYKDLKLGNGGSWCRASSPLEIILLNLIKVLHLVILLMQLGSMVLIKKSILNNIFEKILKTYSKRKIV